MRVVHLFQTIALIIGLLLLTQLETCCSAGRGVLLGARPTNQQVRRPEADTRQIR